MGKKEVGEGRRLVVSAKGVPGGMDGTEWLQCIHEMILRARA